MDVCLLQVQKKAKKKKKKYKKEKKAKHKKKKKHYSCDSSESDSVSIYTSLCYFTNTLNIVKLQTINIILMLNTFYKVLF